MAIAPIQTGVAVIYGIRGNVWVPGLATVVGSIYNSAGFYDRFDLVWRRDAEGDVVGSKMSNLRGECTINFIPYSTAAKSRIYPISLPSPMSRVILNQFEINGLNGEWNYSGEGSISMMLGERMTMTLNLVRFSKIPAQSMATIIYQT